MDSISGFDLSALNAFRWHPHHDRVDLSRYADVAAGQVCFPLTWLLSVMYHFPCTDFPNHPPPLFVTGYTDRETFLCEKRFSFMKVRSLGPGLFSPDMALVHSCRPLIFVVPTHAQHNVH